MKSTNIICMYFSSVSLFCFSGIFGGTSCEELGAMSSSWWRKISDGQKAKGCSCSYYNLIRPISKVITQSLWQKMPSEFSGDCLNYLQLQIVHGPTVAFVTDFCKLIDVSVYVYVFAVVLCVSLHMWHTLQHRWSYGVYSNLVLQTNKYNYCFRTRSTSFDNGKIRLYMNRFQRLLSVLLQRFL